MVLLNKFIKFLITSLVFAFIVTNAHALSVGEAAPVFKARTIDGNSNISLQDFKGKVVLLDFWASWCPPCLKSLPMYDQMRREIGNQHFEILAVNVDENTEDAKKFLNSYPVTYPIVKDPKGTLPGVYGVNAMPTSFLIDRNGKVHSVHKAFREGDMKKLRSEIEALIAAK